MEQEEERILQQEISLNAGVMLESVADEINEEIDQEIEAEELDASAE